MMLKKLILFLSFTLTQVKSNHDFCDLTIVGFVLAYDGIGKIPLKLIECLKDNLTINFIRTRLDNFIYTDTNLIVQKILDEKALEIGNITIFTDILYYNRLSRFYKVQSNSKIKIAYSMFESTRIPDEWVKILNEKFDAVVVPDKFFIEVYKNSGVNIPIFELPLIVDLEDLFDETISDKSKKKIPFIFGDTCVMEFSKNYMKLLEGFSKAFGNNQKIKLKINSKFFNNEILNQFQNKVKQYNLTNVELTTKKLSRKEYIQFMKSLNCFVSLSMGEGFALPPREALALGIPVILSNNSAHKTICESGLVYGVDSNILIPARYRIFKENNNKLGSFSDCSVDDVVKALLDVYKNYEIYVNKAKQGKEWVKQYLKENLKKKYLNLIKPKEIKLGNKNVITNDYLMTDSPQLYKKYLELNKNKKDNKPKLENKKFVIIVPSYNNSKWYKKNLDSILSQTYKNYRVIYFDDASNDNSVELVKNCISKSKFENKFLIIENKYRIGSLANHFRAISMCNANEVIICLDGDDWFINDSVLEFYNEIYSDPNIWLTYGQCIDWPSNRVGLCKNYPENIVNTNKFREYGFWAHQLRTYYAWLAKLVKVEDLLNDKYPGNNSFFHVSGDAALMFPMLEMCKNRFKFINYGIVAHNIENPLNDFKINKTEQSSIIKKIKIKEKYLPLAGSSKGLFNNNSFVLVFDNDIYKTFKSLYFNNIYKIFHSNILIVPQAICNKNYLFAHLQGIFSDVKIVFGS